MCTEARQRRYLKIYRRHAPCLYQVHILTLGFFASFALFSRLLSSASIPMPPKTRPTPSHCILVKLWPNHTTDKIIVSIFRVTVTVTRSRLPNMDKVMTGRPVSAVRERRTQWKGLTDEHLTHSSACSKS